MAKQKPPNCFNCRFLDVTWDKRFPYACKHLGFKGKTLPSQGVFQATGKHCVWFQPKPGSPEAQAQEAEEKPVLPPGCSFTITG